MAGVCEWLNVPLIVQIPLPRRPIFAWSTPEYWTGLVRYLVEDREGEWGKLRAARGRLNPYPLPMVEIGNEPYFNGWRGAWAEYRQAAQEYTDLIKTFNPAIQVGWSHDKAHPDGLIRGHANIGPGPDWIAAYHDYPGDNYWKKKKPLGWPVESWAAIWWADGNVYKDYLGRKGNWGPDEEMGRFLYWPDQIRRVWEKYGDTNAPPIVPTEYNGLFAPGRSEGGWMMEACSIAGALGAFAEQGVQMACKWVFSTIDGRGIGLVVTHDTKPYVELPPHFYVYKLWRVMARYDRMVPLTVVAEETMALPWDKKHPNHVFYAPYGRAWLAEADDGRALWIVNASPTDALRVEVPASWAEAPIRGFTITESNNNPCADNTMNTHDRIDVMGHLCPRSDGVNSAENCVITNLLRAEDLTADKIVVPPLSVSVVEIGVPAEGPDEPAPTPPSDSPPPPEPEPGVVYFDPLHLERIITDVGTTEQAWVRLVNETTETIEVKQFNNRGDFNFADPMPFTLAPDQDRHIPILFSPKQAGFHEASLSIGYDDGVAYWSVELFVEGIGESAQEENPKDELEKCREDKKACLLRAATAEEEVKRLERTIDETALELEQLAQNLRVQK